MSKVDICSLGYDMDALGTCTEWCMTREHSMKIVDAMESLVKEVKE
jgi:hypothetical protein